MMLMFVKKTTQRTLEGPSSFKRMYGVGIGMAARPPHIVCMGTELGKALRPAHEGKAQVSLAHQQK